LAQSALDSLNKAQRSMLRRASRNVTRFPVRHVTAKDAYERLPLLVIQLGHVGEARSRQVIAQRPAFELVRCQHDALNCVMARPPGDLPFVTANERQRDAIVEDYSKAAEHPVTLQERL